MRDRPVDEWERLRRLEVLQARMQVLWDRLEAETDDFKVMFMTAQFDQLEAEERQLLRPGKLRPRSKR
jgi:hypothetical protein